METSLKSIPYNLLIGPLFNPAVIGNYIHHPCVKVFRSVGFAAGSGPDFLTYDIEKDSLADMLNHLPRDWKPDLLIWWDPIYQAIPPGLADCPFPTAVIAGDWNIHFFVTEHYLQAFDFVFADRQLLDILHALGRPNCAYWPGWAFEAEKHFKIPGLDPCFDIAFIGNLNHRVQRQRGAYLERIARLSDRYRVCIEGGIYGADYTRLLNQSRIVFNYSICSGMNMRAFEVPACGALLFLEASNQEVREILTDRESCVLFSSDNLEELLIYYLENEDERARIAAHGHQVIQAWSYEKQFERLIDLLPKVVAAFAAKKQRPFLALTPKQQELIIDRQLYRANTPHAVQLAVTRLSQFGRFGVETAQLEQMDPDLLNQLAKFLFDPLSEAFQDPAPSVQDHALANLKFAIQMLEAARRQLPEQPILTYNLAWCYDLAQRLDEALNLFQETLYLLSATVGLDVWFEPVQPGGFNQRFGVEWERLLAEAALSQDHSLSECRRLLTWRSFERIGHLKMQQYNWADAVAAYHQAQSCFPDFGETELYLGTALLQAGDEKNAMAAYQRAVAKQPFLLPLWKELARLQIKLGEFTQAISFLQDRLVMLHVNPQLKQDEPELSRLLQRAQLGQCLVSKRDVMSYLRGPFSADLYQQLVEWSTSFTIPKELIEVLQINWRPMWPEPLCVLPSQLGFVFCQPQRDMAGILIGLGPAQMPDKFQRTYTESTNLTTGLIGPDRFPFLFPNLERAAKIELEDQQTCNFLLLTDNWSTEQLGQIILAYAKKFANHDDTVLFLWNPLSAPTSAELECLENLLQPISAHISLIQDSMTAEQQGMLLRSMQGVIGDPNQNISYFLAWSLYQGVPVFPTANNPGLQSFSPPEQSLELRKETSLAVIQHSAWPLAGNQDLGEWLMKIHENDSEIGTLAGFYAGVWHQNYVTMGKQILDLCWELRLHIYQSRMSLSDLEQPFSD